MDDALALTSRELCLTAQFYFKGGFVRRRRRCDRSSTELVCPASHHGLRVVIVQEPTNIPHREIAGGAHCIRGTGINHQGVVTEIGTDDLEIGS